jgi:hypothetical protein
MGPTSRDRLAALLWPDSDDRRARGALRRTLSVLVAGLDGRWVRAGRQVVELGDDCWVDHTVARRLAPDPLEGDDPDAEDLAAAVALHRGELLEGFELRDSVAFEDWRRAHAEQRPPRALPGARPAHPCAGGARRPGRRGRARPPLGRADPLGEPAHARLMLLHAWRGERDAAVRRYRECAAILDRELGVRPLARTTALYQAIVDGRLGPSSDRPGVPRGRPPRAPGASDGGPPADREVAELPLVGREDELRRAVDHLLDPDGGLVTIVGEAGIGKTRLTEEIEAGLHRRGAAVVRARCHVGEIGIALGPVVEVLRDAVRAGGVEAAVGDPGLGSP